MRRPWFDTMVTVLCLTVAACTTPSAPTPDTPSTIILQKPVHFSSPDAADRQIDAGTYRVEQATETALRLVPRDKKEPILIQAQAIKHEQSLGDVLAFSIQNKEDEHHVVLLKPDGTGLDAAGTYSGVKSRATGTLVPLSSSFLYQYRYSRISGSTSSTPPPPPPPTNTNPDLVITSAVLTPPSPTPYDLAVLQLTVKNQGLTDAKLEVLTSSQLTQGYRHLGLQLWGSGGNPIKGWGVEPANLPMTIAAGASQVLTVPAVTNVTDAVGTYRWDISLYSFITEANAGNNTISPTFTVRPRPVVVPPAPDLAVSACSFMPANPTQRDIIQLVTQYSNKGTVTATLPLTAPIFQWNSSPAISGRSSFRVGPGASLAPGVVQPWQGQLNMSQALPGTYQISVVVDPDDRVGEVNESNNVVTCTLVVSP